MRAEPQTPLRTPKKGSESNVLYDFVMRGCDRETPRFQALDTEILLGTAYVENRQWVKVELLKNSKRAPRVVSRDGAGGIGERGMPMPIQNEILAPVENEEARLTKRNSETFCEPSDSGDPRSKAGAKVANDFLTHHLEDIGWSTTRRNAVRRNVRTGTMILRSYLDLDNLDTLLIGVTGPKGEPVAVRCGCGWKSAGPDVPMEDAQYDDMAEKAPELAARVKVRSEWDGSRAPGEKGFKRYTATSCLACGGPMVPFIPDDEEKHQKDAFGRPLGVQAPKGCARIESVSPLNWIPQNAGIGVVDPKDIEEVWEQAPKSVDWIKRHYQLNTEQVVPDDPQEIADLFPVSTEGHGTTDRSLYPNHVIWRQFIKQPTMDFPKGRLIVMAGKVCVLDEELMVDSRVPGAKSFPRVKYAVARCFPKEGEVYGMGFPAYVMSAQNRINMTGSQTVDMRERHGTSGIMAPRGMKFAMGWVKNFAGRFGFYDPDPAFPMLKPELIPTKLIDPGAAQEIQDQIQHIQRVLGTMDAEIGEVPKGVSAYSAIALLGEKASERREQREQEIVDAFQLAFQHQLELIQHYYLEGEGRNYRVKAQNGYAKREFYGSQINGETGIKVREQPSYDKSTAEREVLAAQMQNELFQQAYATPHGRREAAKILGMPTSIMEQTNVQMTSVEEKWFDFLNHQTAPGVDVTLDDHFIHYQEFGRLFLTEEGKAVAKDAGWKEIDALIDGWEAQLPPLQQLVMQAQQQGVPVEQVITNLQSMPPQPTVMGQNPDGSPLLGPPPPPYQPPSAFLTAPGPCPEPLEQLIAWLWESMAARKNAQILPEALPWVQMRAVYEAHRLLATGDKAAAAAGQAVLPDPGGTTAGGVSVPGSAPAPGAMPMAA